MSGDAAGPDQSLAPGSAGVPAGVPARGPVPAPADDDGWSWAAWHDEYDVPGSGLAQRLAAVQAQITAVLDQAPPGPLRAVSMCAGQGRDLIGVLAVHPRGADVTARLVELDPDLAAAARGRAAAAGLPQVEVVTGDAAEPAAYAGLVPADLVLACGVFGNVSHEDIQQTIGCCRQLCASGGTVIWTRGRFTPDLVPQVCTWFEERGFERLWVSDPPLGLGAHRFTGRPEPLAAGPRMFTFLPRAEVRRERGLPPC